MIEVFRVGTRLEDILRLSGVVLVRNQSEKALAQTLTFKSSEQTYRLPQSSSRISPIMTPMSK